MSAIELVLDGEFEDDASEQQNDLTVTADQVISQIENLSAEKKKQIEQFAEKIDLHKSGIVINYGATIQKQSAAIVNKTFQDVKTKNTGEISDLLVQMVVAMDSIEGGKDHGGFLSGFLRKLRLSSNSVGTINESAEKTLERIQKQLERHKLTLQKDIVMLDDLYEENWQTFKALTLYIKAAELALDKAKNEELAQLCNKAEISGLPEDAMLADSFSENCDRFEKQIHNLRITHTICLQSAPQIKMIQQNDEDMCMKLQSSIVNTMPLWRKKIAMSIAVNNNLKAAQASNAFDDLTNRMLREQATRFHLGVVESAKDSQRSIIDTETIDYVNKEITGAVLDYIAIEKKGAEDRQKAVAVIENSERELVKGIVSAISKK